MITKFCENMKPPLRKSFTMVFSFIILGSHSHICVERCDTALDPVRVYTKYMCVIQWETVMTQCSLFQFIQNIKYNNLTLFIAINFMSCCTSVPIVHMSEENFRPRHDHQRPISNIWWTDIVCAVRTTIHHIISYIVIRMALTNTPHANQLTALTTAHSIELSNLDEK